MSVREKVANTWAQIAKDPDMQALMEKQGMEIYVASPDETTRLIRESVAEYGKVIRDAKITFRP
jgi:tripartite-type tricarboxylate transporter receptor subunit TctC